MPPKDDRIVAVETGGCPHTAIREDVSSNLAALEDLTRAHKPDLLLLESGGDNLAASFSCELADYTICMCWKIPVTFEMFRTVCSTARFDFVVYLLNFLFLVDVIDVSGGDKIPRKGGPGITESDVLVINKTDIAEAVGSDLDIMARDATMMRGGGSKDDNKCGPIVFAQVKHGVGVREIADHFLHAREHALELDS